MALTLRITSEKNEFLPGESIPIKMILTNHSNASLAIPDFAYNSDLTEILVRDSSGKEIARLNDYTRQQLLGFFVLETITPPEYMLSPGLEVTAEFDVSQYLRLTKTGRYQLAASFRFNDKKIISEPLEITILEGQASQLRHAWQYQKAGKWKCHLFYRDHNKLMHSLGYHRNPEVIDYNLAVKSYPGFDRFVPAASCYDRDDYSPWIVGSKGEQLLAGQLLKDSLKNLIGDFRLEGSLAEKAVVEEYNRNLIVTELFEKQNKIKLHHFDSAGRHIGTRELSVGKGASVLDMAAYKGGQMLLIYSEASQQGWALCAALGGKADFSDIRQWRLWEAPTRFDAALIPPRIKMPSEILAVSFEAPEKALLIYTVNLNPEIPVAVPPRQILNSQGELALHSFAIEPNNAAYLLFIEDGKKLLYYNHVDARFHFITEEKFSDPQLIVSESDGVFLAYIDHLGVVRFQQVEKVVKGY